jgi:hypothetical protein
VLLPAGRAALALADDAPAVGRACLDWTERVPHVSGPLGTTVCATLLGRGWLARRPGSRALRVTPRGARALAALGVRWT